MLIGPIFSRELVTAPRRPQHFISRTTFVAALLILSATAWLVMTGTQKIRNVGDMARFGAMLFQILAPLQLALLSFLAALRAAGNVAQEKDKKTMVLLLMTRLNNSELVLGKLMASLLEVLSMGVAAIPLFMGITLFGGVSLEQVAKMYAVTLVTVFAAGSLGTMTAMWREKTFQTLAIVTLGLVLWIGIGEMLPVIAAGREWLGRSVDVWATAISPLRAIFAAASPSFGTGELGRRDDGLPLFLIIGSSLAFLLNATAILLVRRWNPSRDARPQQEEESSPAAATIWTAEHAVGEQEALADMRRRESAEAARSGHIDSRVKKSSETSREVWDNPILWREMCTWAYGRKVLIIRLTYLLFTLIAAAGLYNAATAATNLRPGDESAAILPDTAKPLAPFFLVSLVIVNALAVTSITNERDGGALDLLLVTDLEPREFLWGKVLGVAYVTKEMIAAPMLLCLGLYFFGGVTLENLFYCVICLAVMNLFAIMLGIHCGMSHDNSRTAVLVSLGTVFFLFLGVVTLLVLMVSFSGSFQTQLAPFLAFIVGGSVGLFVALGSRNPSPAIALASIALPFCTFFALTSFLIHHPLEVFLVTLAAYGITIAAMLVPALSEFDFAQGRSKGGIEG